MMRIGKRTRRVVCALGLATGLAAAAPVAAPALIALARIEPGEWQIKTVGSDAPARLLCVRDPMMFIRYNRRGRGCEHSIIVNDAETATVEYRCGDGATGRATLHVATPRAFNLDMQGLDGGLPYEDSYEAHRLGDCAVPHGAAR